MEVAAIHASWVIHLPEGRGACTQHRAPVGLYKPKCVGVMACLIHGADDEIVEIRSHWIRRRLAEDLLVYTLHDSRVAGNTRVDGHGVCLDAVTERAG